MYLYVLDFRRIERVLCSQASLTSDLTGAGGGAPSEEVPAPEQATPPPAASPAAAPAAAPEMPMPTIIVREEKEGVPPDTEHVPAADPVPAAHPPAVPPASEAAVAWAQCGGEGWPGPTHCVEGFECRPQEGNKWYSQCR